MSIAARPATARPGISRSRMSSRSGTVAGRGGDRAGLPAVRRRRRAPAAATPPAVYPSDPRGSAGRVIAATGPVDAVVAADAPMLGLAATVAARLGLAHNPVEAVIAATDKTQQRYRWARAAVPQPSFRIVPATASADSVREAAAQVGFPCVVKAVSLSASQGILRADDPAGAVAAARRIRRILVTAGRPGNESMLIEEYLPGQEL